MKKLLVSLLCLSNLSVLAQVASPDLPKRGDWLVGIDVAQLSVYKLGGPGARVSVGDVSVLGGKFVTNRTALGVSIPAQWQTIAGSFNLPRTTVSSYGVVPFARFYLTESRVRPYLGVGAGYMVTKYSRGLEMSQNGLTYNGNAGLAYFLNRNVSIDAVANYTSQPNQAASGSTSGSETRLNFLLRFQVFLGR